MAKETAKTLFEKELKQVRATKYKSSIIVLLGSVFMYAIYEANKFTMEPGIQPVMKVLVWLFPIMFGFGVYIQDKKLKTWAYQNYAYRRERENHGERAIS